jgi:hypothetical protein
VTADAAGNAFFGYHRNTDCHIMLRALSAGGALGSAIDVSQQPDKAVGDTSPSIATAGGNVILVWHRDGDLYDHADDTVYFNFVAGGTTPGTPTQLGASGDVSMMGVGAAGGPDGNFGVTWQGRVSGQVWYRGISSNGTPLAAQAQLSVLASRADSAPGLAVGPSAGTAVVWSSDADGLVNFSSSAGTYTPPEPISGAGASASVVKKSVSLRGGSLRFKLVCAAPVGATCAGKVKLSDRRLKRAYGSTKFTLAAGATTRFKLKLNSRARAKLRAAGSLKSYLGVSTTGGKPTGLKLSLRR